MPVKRIKNLHNLIYEIYVKMYVISAKFKYQLRHLSHI